MVICLKQFRELESPNKVTHLKDTGFAMYWNTCFCTCLCMYSCSHAFKRQGIYLCKKDNICNFFNYFCGNTKTYNTLGVFCAFVGGLVKVVNDLCNSWIQCLSTITLTLQAWTTICRENMDINSTAASGSCALTVKLYFISVLIRWSWVVLPPWLRGTVAFISFLPFNMQPVKCLTSRENLYLVG